MPHRILMGTLVTRCKRRADKEFDEHISTAEWKALISEKYGEHWGVIAETGCLYHHRTATITATGAASYAEPADHMSTIGMDLVRSDGSRREVTELQIQERNLFAGQVGEAFFFRHVDDLIFLHPNPSSGTYELLYIPQPTDISEYADDQPVDLMTADGAAALIWGVAAMAADKSEANLQFKLRQEELATERLRMWAINKSLLEPRRRVITDPHDLRSTDPAEWFWR